jgi:hypothetical protein
MWGRGSAMDERWIRIGIEISEIDCIGPGWARWGGRYGRCGHISSGGKGNGKGTVFLLWRGRRGGKRIRINLVDGGWRSGYRAPAGVVGGFV